MTKPILRVAVTGGAGQIAYSLLFRIANGELFGFDQPLSLHILELPEMLPIVEGVKMELQDCIFPLLHAIEITSDAYRVFQEVHYAILIGAKPRGPGMERGDLLRENAKIFIEQGKALNEVAHQNVKVFVIGNPCNTNCLIAMSYAPRLSRKNFYAMTRLDQNRAEFFLAQKAQLPVQEVSHMVIWGNHSSTQVPDFIHARIQGGPVENIIKERHWLENDFFDLVRTRGAAIIEKRGKSSAASAAQAILDTVRDTLSPTTTGSWFSLAIESTGNPYGIEDNLIFSFPCYTSSKGEVLIASQIDVPYFLKEKIKVSERELLEERNIARSIF